MLSWLPTHLVQVENALRAGTPSGGSASEGIVPEVIAQRAVSLQEWQNAVNLARNPFVQNRRDLYRVYDNIMLDLQLTTLLDKRVEKLQADKFKIMGPDGTEQPELAALLQTMWFRNFIRHVIESIAYGHSLLELADQAPTPKTIKVNGRSLQYYPLLSVPLVSRPHVRPEKGQWVRNVFDQEGPSFRDPAVRNYYLEAGEPTDLGLLYKITPVALAKRYAMGSWSEFNDKLAIPFRWVTMKSPDAKREQKLAQILQNMGSAGWGIFHPNEEIKLLESAKSDPHKCFLELLVYCDKQMSKAISGETLTTDEGAGSKSQGVVHQEVAELKHEADRTFLEYIVNEQLLPRLVWIGYPLAGCKYVRDDSMEMSPQDQIKIDQVLLQFYNLDPQYIADKYDIKLDYIKGKTPEEVKEVLEKAVKKPQPVA
ncbi:Protein of unknown function [Hymenobacter daecheongensis DSM 21074]|uniref:Mu-like prophage protein gp29 n=2 Tax=Hymenobacter daecheongensis TaxID=496053 RepID=A0A1M6LWZ2_9BACT|nr:Protein of unknown function [Hymenobacter daecheongensis DSM 21074]